jgi:hypothetical protein
MGLTNHNDLFSEQKVVCGRKLNEIWRYSEEIRRTNNLLIENMQVKLVDGVKCENQVSGFVVIDFCSSELGRL